MTSYMLFFARTCRYTSSVYATSVVKWTHTVLRGVCKLTGSTGLGLLDFSGHVHFSVAQPNVKQHVTYIQFN